MCSEKIMHHVATTDIQAHHFSLAFENLPFDHFRTCWTLCVAITFVTIVSGSKFENEHKDDIIEILQLIEFIKEEYVEERYPEIYNFGPERLGIYFKDKLVLMEYSSDYLIKECGYSQLDYFRNVIKSYQG